MPKLAAIIVLALAAVLATPACGGAEDGLDGVPIPNATATTASTSQPAGTRARTATPTPTWTPTPTETASQLSLAFVRDGDIWMINADGAGEHRLTDWGDLARYSGSFSWAPTGDMIAADRASLPSALNPGSDYRVSVIDLKSETVLERPGAQFVSWSPRGDLLAYSAGPLWDWKVVDLQGKEVLRLSDASAPVWSPDESKIAYGRIVDWNCIEPCTTPVVLDLNDGSVWEVDPLSRSAGGIGFSPDGRWLSYGSALFNVTTHEERRLPGLKVSWSPDGDYLTLLLGADYDRLAVYDVGNEEVVWQDGFVLPATDAPPASTVQGTWSPDGSRFLYLRFAEQPRENVTRVVEVETGRVESMSDVEWPIDISPDGRYITYATGGELARGGEVWVMGIDGTGRTRLGEGAYPKWQPVSRP